MGLGTSASEVPGRWGKCRLEVTLPASWIRNYTWAPAARLKRYFRWLLDAIKCEHQVDRLLIRIPPSVKLRWKQAVLVWGEGRLRTNYKTRHLSIQLIYSFTTKWLWCLHPFLGLLSIIYFFPRLPAPWGQEPHLSCSGLWASPVAWPKTALNVWEWNDLGMLSALTDEQTDTRRR